MFGRAEPIHRTALHTFLAHLHTWKKGGNIRRNKISKERAKENEEKDRGLHDYRKHKVERKRKKISSRKDKRREKIS